MRLAKRYDNPDSDKEFDYPKAIFRKAEIKRVNIQIPFSLYQQALRIGNRSGTGYQNALKMAMTIGLKHLEEAG